jgi:hypothetical protein
VGEPLDGCAHATPRRGRAVEAVPFIDTDVSAARSHIGPRPVPASNVARPHRRWGAARARVRAARAGEDMRTLTVPGALT